MIKFTAILLILACSLRVLGSEDQLFDAQPEAVRKAIQDCFPHARIWAVKKRSEDGQKLFEITLFSLNGGSKYSKPDGYDEVQELITYTLITTSEGKVLEESPHGIELKSIPDAVVKSYAQWNSANIKGMMVTWAVQKERGKDRVYSVGITLNQVEEYYATFDGDGKILKSKFTQNGTTIEIETTSDKVKRYRAAPNDVFVKDEGNR